MGNIIADSREGECQTSAQEASPTAFSRTEWTLTLQAFKLQKSLENCIQAAQCWRLGHRVLNGGGEKRIRSGALGLVEPHL